MTTERYQVVSLIELIEMPNDQNPIEKGTKGYIVKIQPDIYDVGYLLTMEWENGRSLNLLTKTDLFKVLKFDAHKD